MGSFLSKPRKIISMLYLIFFLKRKYLFIAHDKLCFVSSSNSEIFTSARERSKVTFAAKTAHWKKLVDQCFIFKRIRWALKFRRDLCLLSYFPVLFHHCKVFACLLRYKMMAMIDVLVLRFLSVCPRIPSHIVPIASLNLVPWVKGKELTRVSCNSILKFTSNYSVRVNANKAC